MLRLIAVGFIASGIGVQTAAAQALPRNSAFVVDGNGTSVQLPQFNFFTISTSVMVPDRGSAMLGGVGRGASASSVSGPPVFSQRTFATGQSTGSMSVAVQVHDLKAMDRELLADAAAARRTDDPARTWADRVARAKESSAGRPAISVAEARRLRDTPPAAR